MSYSELENGHYYYVPFISQYESKGPYSVKVIGQTTKSEISNFTEFDIRSTFFDDVGIKTYLSMVTSTTVLYICQVISSTDPIELDDSENILIPFSIIDFSNVDEYLTTTRFSFEIEGVRRQFDKTTDLNDFVSELESSIPSAIAKETILANDVLSLSNTQEEILVLKSVIDKEEDERDAYILKRQNNITLLKKQEAQREMNYYSRVDAVKKREEAVALKEAEIDSVLALTNKKLIAANKWLSCSNYLLERMYYVYEKIRQLGITSEVVNMPSWDELKVYVYDTDASGISMSAWKAAIDTYIETGEYPDDWESVDTNTTCPYCKTDLS